MFDLKKNLFESRDPPDLRDFRDLIYTSLDLTKTVEQLLGPSGLSGPYMYNYLLRVVAVVVEVAVVVVGVVASFFHWNKT